MRWKGDQGPEREGAEETEMLFGQADFGMDLQDWMGEGASTPMVQRR